jgi:hypothetical protein
MHFSLFHLSGHPKHPSPVFSLLGKRDNIGGSLKGLMYYFPPILTIFYPRAFCSVLNFGVVVTCTPKRHVPHSLMRRRSKRPEGRL